MAAKYTTSEAVREQLEAVYHCVKTGALNTSVASTAANILKTIGILLREEKELDIEAQLNELREAINQLKGESQI